MTELLLNIKLKVVMLLERKSFNHHSLNTPDSNKKNYKYSSKIKVSQNSTSLNNMIKCT